MIIVVVLFLIIKKLSFLIIFFGLTSRQIPSLHLQVQISHNLQSFCLNTYNLIYNSQFSLVFDMILEYISTKFSLIIVLDCSKCLMQQKGMDDFHNNNNKIFDNNLQQ